MVLYKTTIKPISSFITPLKGDTFFGEICWAIRYAFGNERLEELLKNYIEKPFLIVSDGFASGFLPKPTMPSSFLNESLENKKENRKKVWLKPEELKKGEFDKAVTNEEAKFLNVRKSTIKTSLNYLTFTTDDSGNFAPYSVVQTTLNNRDIYFLIDENIFTLDELDKSLKMVSKMGYGKKASTGNGFFEYSNLVKVEIESSSSAFMALSPVVLEEGKYKDFFYEPFTRFGKHGGFFANTNPFKNPILLADTGAVVMFEQKIDMQYIGQVIKGHSKEENTVHQGYGILIPLEVNYGKL